jgi:PKD repeat protein
MRGVARALGKSLLALLGLALIVGTGAPTPDEPKKTAVTVVITGGDVTGTVTSSPAGFNCRASAVVQGGEGACVVEYTESMNLTLYIVPGPGAIIVGTPDCEIFAPASSLEPATCGLTTAEDVTIEIEFAAADAPPVAAFTIAPAQPLVGTPATFDASGSSDDTGIATHAWSFGDGSAPASGVVVTHTYQSAGLFTVSLAVTDISGRAVVLARNVTVVVAATAPTISQPPASVTVSPGADATFSVVAAGTAPFQYQWQRGGVDIAGATSANYTLPAAAAADDGAQFRVVVSNAVGSVTSAPAVLTVGRGWRVIGGSVATTGSQAPTLAVDAAGTPFVACSQFTGGLSRIFVRRFDGAGWVILGAGGTDPVDPSSTSSARESALVIGADGQPIVAWIESARVRVARWTGASWNFIGDDLSIDTTDSFPLSGIQLERDGDDLVAAWIETLPGAPFPSVQLAVKRHDAAAGTWSGDYVPNVDNPSQLRMALDPGGMPIIAYVSRELTGNDRALQVVRRSATGWAPVGGDVGPVPPFINSTARVYGFDIRVDAGGAPHVFGSVNGTTLFAYRHDPMGWQPLTGGDGVFVTLDPLTQGTAAMAFTRGTPRLVMAYARQELPAVGPVRYVTEFLEWNGTAWQMLAEPASVTDNTTVISPALVAGQPMFAAEYRLSRIVVQKFVP